MSDNVTQWCECKEIAYQSKECYICSLSAEINDLQAELAECSKARDAWAHQCNVATESLHDWQSKFSAMSLVANDHAMGRIKCIEERDAARAEFAECKSDLENGNSVSRGSRLMDSLLGFIFVGSIIYILYLGVFKL